MVGASESRKSSYSGYEESRNSQLMNNHKIQESSHQNQQLDSNRKSSYTYNNLLFDSNDQDTDHDLKALNNNSNGYTKSSSYSASYQKTSVNGKASESSSYNEQHYDSRDGCRQAKVPRRDTAPRAAGGR